MLTLAVWALAGLPVVASYLKIYFYCIFYENGIQHSILRRIDELHSRYCLQVTQH